MFRRTLLHPLPLRVLNEASSKKQQIDYRGANLKAVACAARVSLAFTDAGNAESQQHLHVLKLLPYAEPVRVTSLLSLHRMYETREQ